ncbi:hypothetical protein HYDPIDRAFT_165944 [Hydnomerulius pinastri MD-312]|nr:hypothetical protein HYDPIDRAFT_165944 [Hydnomerulius pinastri MD-312]
MGIHPILVLLLPSLPTIQSHFATLSLSEVSDDAILILHLYCKGMEVLGTLPCFIYEMFQLYIKEDVLSSYKTTYSQLNAVGCARVALEVKNTILDIVEKIELLNSFCMVIWHYLLNYITDPTETKGLEHSPEIIVTAPHLPELSAMYPDEDKLLLDVKECYEEDPFFKKVVSAPKEYWKFEVWNGYVWVEISKLKANNCLKLLLARPICYWLTLEQEKLLLTFESMSGGRTWLKMYKHSPYDLPSWEAIGVDFVGPLPLSNDRDSEYDSVTVIIDLLTTMVHIVPS